MTEQVIDIRDRIEKMRTEMTGSPNSVPKKKGEFSNNETKNLSLKAESNNLSPQQKKSHENKTHERVVSDQPNQANSINQDNLDYKIKKNRITEEVFENPKLNQESSVKKKNVIQSKIYKDYQNDNIYDEKKNSVKFEEDQPFPQFNLNVSNPISWKLMLFLIFQNMS